jgi:hypothetical protein
VAFLLHDTKMVETEWEFHGGDDSSDWVYLNDEATFSHKNACEFILWVPDDRDAFEERLCGMREAGCSPDLIEAFTEARRRGAEKLLIYS